MNTFDLTKATERLLRALSDHHLTVKRDLLRAEPLPENPFFIRTWTKRLPFFHLVLNHFGTNTIEWFSRIQDNTYCPEWYVVCVDPDVSPLTHLDDWRLAAPCQADALAEVLQAISRVRAKLASVTYADGAIVIEGEHGPIATIERMSFTPTSEVSLKRAANALKGITKSCNSDFVTSLRQLQGYEGTSRIDTQIASPNVEPVHIDPRNLCTSLLVLLSETVEERVPRNQAQELLATFFGVESWQHLIAHVKRREKHCLQPFMLTSMEPQTSDYQTVRYSLGLPSAVYHFGQWLRHQSRTTINCNSLSPIRVDNLEVPDGGWFEVLPERSGISLKEMRIVDPDTDYQSAARELLRSHDIESGIKTYLFSDLGEKERMIEFNARDGVNRTDNLVIGGWIYYVNRGYPGGLFAADRIGETLDESRLIGSELRRAALVRVESQYWLATDWDQKPKHHLPGLDEEGAKLIQEKFGIEIV